MVLMVPLLAVAPALAREPAERMPGYLVSPPPGQLLAHAVNNGDGTVTIPSGMHSAAANAWHRKVCRSFGATDISDDGPITFSADSPDAAACLSPLGKPPSTRAVILGTDREGRFYLPSTALLPLASDPDPRAPHASPPTLPPRIVPHSSTGSVPLGS